MQGEKKSRNAILNIIGNRQTLTTLIVLLSLSLIGVSVWFLLFNKSPRQAYMEAESRNFKRYSQQLKSMYKDFYENQKPYMDSSYKKRMEFTADITSDSKAPFGIQNAENILDVLRRCKFIIDFNSNSVSNQSQTKLSLLVEKAPFLDAQAFIKDRKLNFTVPVLLPDKYFTADMEKLDQVYDRFGIPFRPKRIAKAVDVAKAISFSEDKSEVISREYGMLLSSSIKDSNVKYGEKVSVKIGNEVKNGRQVMVNLNSEEAKKLSDELIEKIGTDENILRLTCENYADIARVFDEAGFFQVHKVLDDLGYLKLNDILKNYISDLNVKKDTGAFIKALKKFKDESAYPEGVSMVLIVDNSGNILSRTVNTSIQKKNGGKVLLELHTGTNDVKDESFGKGFASINITFDNGGKDRRLIGWSINSNVVEDPKNESKKGTISINHERKINDVEEFAIKANLDMDSRLDAATLKRNSSTKYEISFTGTDPKLIDRFFGELKNESWKNNKQKTRNSNYTMTMNFDLPTLDLKNTVVKFDLKQEDRFGIDFSLPEVGAADIVDLNNITDKDLGKVKEDILKSFGVFYLENKPIFDALLGQK